MVPKSSNTINVQNLPCEIPPVVRADMNLLIGHYNPTVRIPT